MSPFVLLSLFWPPTFRLPLCLSLSLLFVSFFLPSCLSLLSFCSFFVSFYLFLSSLALLHEQNNTKLLNVKCFFHQSFLFVWFLVLCSLANAFFLSLLFPDFDLCFLSNINVFAFKEGKKTPIIEKRGLQQNIFLWTCVLQNVKSYRFFGAIFCQILVDVQITQ